MGKEEENPLPLASRCSPRVRSSLGLRKLRMLVLVRVLALSLFLPVSLLLLLVIVVVVVVVVVVVLLVLWLLLFLLPRPLRAGPPTAPARPMTPLSPPLPVAHVTLLPCKYMRIASARLHLRKDVMFVENACSVM